MLNLLMMIDTRYEAEAMKKVFEESSINVLTTVPSYSNYIKTLQYFPDCIFMELPKQHSNQLHFIQMLKQNTRASEIAVICYGDKLLPQFKEGLLKIGITAYIDKPLDTEEVIKTIFSLVKKPEATLKKNVSKEKSFVSSDIQPLLSAKITVPEKISYMRKFISGLMAFPFTVTRVLELTKNEDATANDLARVIETDPVISTNILRLANSVYFAANNKTISSVKQGIVRIGFAETRRIVMSMSVLQLFDTQSGNIGFSRVEFWYHNLATAIACQKLARLLPSINSEEAFLSGLLHDFGIVLLDEFFSPLFAMILKATTDHGAHFSDKEREILGFTHHQLVAELFQEWKIPETIRGAVSTYHTVALDKNVPDNAENNLALCIFVANTIIKSYSFGSGCDQYITPIPRWIFEKLNISETLPNELINEVRKEMVLYKDLLQVSDEQSRKVGEAGFIEARSLAIGIANLSNAIFFPPIPFLKQQGHTVTEIKNSDNAMHKYDLVLINADRSTSPESIAPFLTLECSEPLEKGVIKGAKGIAPVLIFTDTYSRFSDFKKYLTVSFMIPEFDLRQLDVAVHTIMNGLQLGTVISTDTVPLSGGTQDQYLKITPGTIYTLITDASRLQKTCVDKNILSFEAKKAKVLLEAGRLFKRDRSDVDAYWALSLAISYYHVAISKEEIASAEKELGIIQNNLTGDQLKLYKEIIGRIQ